jgi:hypothetical protein
MRWEGCAAGMGEAGKVPSGKKTQMKESTWKTEAQMGEWVRNNLKEIGWGL